MVNVNNDLSRSKQAYRRASQAQSKYADAGRYCSDKIESWHWHEFDTYSEELQQIITLITDGYEPGKAIKEEDGHEVE